jgi:poly(3-hydroxyalkanoate) synthetase
MVAGTSDDITLPDQVFAIYSLVGTPEGQKHRFLVDSGHIGLFMGSTALREVWPKLAALIRTHEIERSDWMDHMLERCWY